MPIQGHAFTTKIVPQLASVAERGEMDEDQGVDVQVDHFRMPTTTLV